MTPVKIGSAVIDLDEFTPESVAEAVAKALAFKSGWAERYEVLLPVFTAMLASDSRGAAAAPTEAEGKLGGAPYSVDAQAAETLGLVGQEPMTEADISKASEWLEVLLGGNARARDYGQRLLAEVRRARASDETNQERVMWLSERLDASRQRETALERVVEAATEMRLEEDVIYGWDDLQAALAALSTVAVDRPKDVRDG